MARRISMATRTELLEAVGARYRGGWHEVIQSARRRQETPEWRAVYGVRAGIEGCLSQAVRLCGLRRSRYVGLAKAHL